MESSSSVAVVYYQIVPAVDSSLSAELNDLAMSSFGMGVQLAFVACAISAGILMLGVGIMKAISSP